LDISSKPSTVEVLSNGMEDSGEMSRRCLKRCKESGCKEGKRERGTLVVWFVLNESVRNFRDRAG
jgi:hypothetical protein